MHMKAYLSCLLYCTEARLDGSQSFLCVAWIASKIFFLWPIWWIPNWNKNKDTLAEHVFNMFLTNDWKRVQEVWQELLSLILLHHIYPNWGTRCEDLIWGGEGATTRNIKIAIFIMMLISMGKLGKYHVETAIYIRQDFSRCAFGQQKTNCNHFNVLKT